jgi:hypothetical protein
VLLADAQLRDFVVSDSICDLEFDVAFGGRVDSCPGELVFDSRGLWKLFRNTEGFCFRLATEFIGTLPYKLAIVARDFKSGRIEMSREYFGPGQSVNPLEYPLDELLWIHRLALGEGVEVRGCGVIAPDGRGLLLTGHSGAGKTLARRCRNRRGRSRAAGWNLHSHPRPAKRNTATQPHHRVRGTLRAQFRAASLDRCDHFRSGILQQGYRLRALLRIFICSGFRRSGGPAP